MDPMTSTVGQQIITGFSQYGYFALVPLFVIEGPIVGFTSGILISLGVLSALPVFLIYVSGKIISDTALYLLAKNGSSLLYKLPLGDRVLVRMKFGEKEEPEWANKFRDNYFSFMMFGKVAPVLWLSDAAAVAAGIFRIPWRKFYLPVFIGQPIWSAAVIALGYYFGSTLQDPRRLISRVSIFMLVGVIILGLYYYYLHDRIKEKVFYQLFTRSGSDE